MPHPPHFSKQTLEFIDKASRQKHEEWLNRNRENYERYLLLPIQELARQLKEKLGPTVPTYHFPQKGLARLKRSANRAEEYGSLYKDWVSYSASRPRQSRFEHNPNLFFLLEPGEPDGDEVLLAGGLYMPSSRQLRTIREAIAQDTSAFDRLFASKPFSSRFPGGFSDERIATRPPRGFDPAHPKMNWLKLQAFFVWKPYKKREFASKHFISEVVKDCAQILRLNALLDQVILNRGLVNAPEQQSKGLLTRIEEFQITQRKMDF